MGTTQQSKPARITIGPDLAWDEQDADLFGSGGALVRRRDCVRCGPFASSARRVTGFEIAPAGKPAQARSAP